MKRVVACLLLVGLTGCALRAPHFYKPVIPPPVGVRYTLDQFLKDKAELDSNPTKLLRDRIIRQIEREVEIEYSEYEMGLASSRGAGSIGFDLLEGGAGVGGALVGAEQAKQVISVALLGTQGLHRSIDKNLFANLPTEIIITAMRSAREDKRVEIERKMALGVEAYPWVEAQLDLTQLYYRGTLQNALQALASAASAKQTQADDAKSRVLDMRTPKP